MKTADQIWEYLKGIQVATEKSGGSRILEIATGVDLSCHLRREGRGVTFWVHNADVNPWVVPKGFRKNCGCVFSYDHSEVYHGPFEALVDWLRWQGTGWWS